MDGETLPEVRNLVTWGSLCSCGKPDTLPEAGWCTACPPTGCTLPPAPPLPCSPSFQTSPSTAAGVCPTPSELHALAELLFMQLSAALRRANAPSCQAALGLVSLCLHPCKLGIDLGEPQRCKQGAQEGIKRGGRAGLGGRGRLAS